MVQPPAEPHWQDPSHEVRDRVGERRQREPQSPHQDKREGRKERGEVGGYILAQSQGTSLPPTSPQSSCQEKSCGRVGEGAEVKGVL